MVNYNMNRKIGVVGSGLYKNKSFFIKVLNRDIDKENDIIVSGHSPRNKIYDGNGKVIGYDNIDLWAELWANDNCKIEPIIHPSYGYTSDSFFARNKLIAEELNKKEDELRAFIPQGLYKSGTWNTIKHFANLYDDWNKRLIIYNEFGGVWVYSEYPNWLRNKLKQRKMSRYF